MFIINISDKEFSKITKVFESDECSEEFARGYACAVENFFNSIVEDEPTTVILLKDKKLVHIGANFIK